MGSSATSEAEYAAFQQKVNRTVYVDNLSPEVTESVLRTAVDQFGTVKSIQFIPNYIYHGIVARCALVEMENSKQAKAVVEVIAQFPFMMSGIPRPVRALPAEEEMFDERPVKPGRRIQCPWLEPDHPDFEVANKIKRATLKHSAQASFLHKHQLQQEEKLAKEQAQVLKTSYKKFEMIDGVIHDGTARALAEQYKIRVSND